MGTRAHWLKEGWRLRRSDDEGEPLSWQHARTLTDIRAEAETFEIGEQAEVQKFDKRVEHYVPYGTVSKVRRKPGSPRDFTTTVRVTREQG